MTLTVYIAAPYAARSQVAEHLKELETIGFKTQCRWADGTHEFGPEGAAFSADPTERARWAMEDISDIDDCDIVVAFTAAAILPLPERVSRGTSGGRHIETGYAIAKRKTVILIGDPENVFHWLPTVWLAKDWHEAVVGLSAHLVKHLNERGVPA